MIHVNWKVYDDNDLVTVVNNDYSVVKRFTRPCQNRRAVHCELKTIVRGGMRDVRFVKNPHTCDNRTFSCCNVLGEQVDSKAAKTIRVIHKEAWLNHYICKTIEEYCHTKLVRRGGHTAHIKDLRYNINFFFNYNRHSIEKVKYYKEHYSNSIPISVKYIDNSTSIIKDGPETVKTVKRAGTQSKNTPVLQQHIENYVKRSKVYIPQYHPENVQSSKRSSIKNIRQSTVEEIAKFRNKQ